MKKLKKISQVFSAVTIVFLLFTVGLSASVSEHKSKMVELAAQGQYDKALVEKSWFDIKAYVIHHYIKTYGHVNAFLCLLVLLVLIFHKRQGFFRSPDVIKVITSVPPYFE